MSLNSKKYYTSGRTLKSKGNQTMLNNIEKNAYNPTGKLSKKRESFVNSELDKMKCGGKVYKMEYGDEVLEDQILKEWAESRGGYKPPVFNRPDSYEDYEYKTGWQRGSLSDEEREYEKEWLENYYYPKHNRQQRTSTFFKPNLKTKKLTKRQFQKQNPETVGYEMGYGGNIPKMPGGGFLGDYTMPMSQATKRGAFEYRFRPSYNTVMGTTGQLDFRKGWQGRDRKATHNILGNVYGGKNQFGTTAGGSLGYGMQYNWNPDMNTYFRGDAGYDKQLGVNAGIEAGHRWNIVPTKETKSGAKHSGSFDAFGGFGVHSKPDQRLAEYTPVFDNSGQIRDWSKEGFNRHVKFNYGIGANYQRELGPGKLGVFGKVIMDPAGGKILRTQGVPLEEDTGLIERQQSGKVNWTPNVTAGLTYTMNTDPGKRKVRAQIEKQKARDEAIEREQEMLARREEERQRQQQGELEFVKGSATPLEQQFGGEVMELTDKQIQELRKGGHLVIEQ